MSCPAGPFGGHSLPEAPPVAASAAVFSPCGRYRWWLRRSWDPLRPRLLFVGLNPSSAEGERDDPTLRRLVAWGLRPLALALARTASGLPGHPLYCPAALTLRSFAAS